MPLPGHVVGGTVIASAWGNAVVDGLPQIGFIGMWAGDAAPTDHLMCRGQAVSRTTYAALFALVGVRFGAGDTTTTFNLPDLRGRYPVGYNVGGTYFTAGVGERYGSTVVTLPAHQHGVPNHLHAVNINSADRSNVHQHILEWGEVYQAWPAGEDNVDSFRIALGGGAFSIVIHKFTAHDYPTGNETAGHGHNVSGFTAGSDRDLTSSIVGGDASLGNLPPSLSLNFVVRAL